MTGNSTNRLVAWARAIAVTLPLVLGLASFAHSQGCDNSITACGCTITRTGTYNVNGALFSSQGLTRKGDCIDVSAANVVLLLNKNDITGGSKTGSAIRVLPTAPGTFVAGSNASLTGWDTAVNVQGNRALVKDVVASDNGTAGFQLDQSSNSVIDSVQSGANGVAGIVVRGGGANQLSDFDAFGNTVYGVWVRNSTNNSINNGDLENNGNSGIYLGCSSTGPGGAKCGNGTIRHNRIFNNLLLKNTSYGIALDLMANNSIVTSNVAFDAGIDDLFDGNKNCDTNDWLDNDLTSASQSCIH